MGEDLVAKWKEAARRDDLFRHMVPSDVRQLIAEIEALSADRDRLRKDNVRLREALEEIRAQTGYQDVYAAFGSFENINKEAREALAATDDLSGYVLVPREDIDEMFNVAIQVTATAKMEAQNIGTSHPLHSQYRGWWQRCEKLTTKLHALLDAAQEGK